MFVKSYELESVMSWLADRKYPTSDALVFTILITRELTEIDLTPRKTVLRLPTSLPPYTGFTVSRV